MVLIELTGLTINSVRVFSNSLYKAIKQTIALNAPNGNIFQKIGACFGFEFSTQMRQSEALQILGFEKHKEPSPDDVKLHLDRMLSLNDVSKGGSPYLTERFIAAAHTLARSYHKNKVE